ncbi:unnamed protein product [Alternaria alternata]
MSQPLWTLPVTTSSESSSIPQSPATPPRPASNESDDVSKPPATVIPAYSFPSVKARRKFVETHTELIVETIKSGNMELLVHRGTLVQMASAFIYGIQEDNASHYLQAPDIDDPETLTEAYFTLWAHTLWGRNEIMPWSAFHRNVYDAFEAPRFLRELLTRGTRLYWEWTTGRGLRLTTDQRITMALLRSEDLMLCAISAQNMVDDLFFSVHNHELSLHDLKSIKEFLSFRENDFDQEFPTIRPWYDFAQIGYHDIPDWPASSNTPSRLVTDLPAEIMLMILEKVFKINGDIHVVFDRSENEHIALVERERRLQEHPFGVHGQRLPYGNYWKLPSVRHFFAFGITSRGNWLMMKEMFYQKNKFIIHED